MPTRLHQGGSETRSTVFGFGDRFSLEECYRSHDIDRSISTHDIDHMISCDYTIAGSNHACDPIACLSGCCCSDWRRIKSCRNTEDIYGRCPQTSPRMGRLLRAHGTVPFPLYQPASPRNGCLVFCGHTIPCSLSDRFCHTPLKAAAKLLIEAALTINSATAPMTSHTAEGRCQAAY
jgi:hypothetical protein